MSGIVRITMFKVPTSESREAMLKNYETLSKTAVKDGAPYITSLSCGTGIEDPRSQGYNLIAKTEFKTLEDMQYYDSECEAHKKFKMGIKELGNVKPAEVCCVYYEPKVVA
ncbi:hypothetical protein CJF32_00001308 [Rutstroemia sp. NJR-2017a WRK4]|nr:hypothetical protein CJF32_00001308 [Rutstroemia sp. NJR-2017a WRK4]